MCGSHMRGSAGSNARRRNFLIMKGMCGGRHCYIIVSKIFLGGKKHGSKSSN